MNINILSQKIANNTEDFSAEKIREYFKEYGKQQFEKAVNRCKEKATYYEVSPPAVVDFIENVKTEFVE